MGQSGISYQLVWDWGSNGLYHISRTGTGTEVGCISYQQDWYSDKSRTGPEQ